MIPYFVVLAVTSLLSMFSRLVSGAKHTVRDNRIHVKSTAIVGTEVIDSSTQQWNFFDYAILTLLVAFSGLRYGIGTDYTTYHYMFSALVAQDWLGSIAASPVEPGYTILSLAVKTAIEDSRAIFWVAALITVVLVFVAIKRSSTDLFLSLFLYFTLAFYLASFNATRQGIAIAIVLFADYYYKRNKVTFFLLMAVAISIHISTIFVLAIYLLSRHLRPNLLLVVGMLFLGAALASSAFIEDQLSGLLVGLNPRYGGYLIDNPTGLGTYLVILSKIIIICYMLWIGREDDSNSHYRTLVIFSLVFLVAGTAFKVLVRMEMFFGIFIILAIPNLLAGRKGAGFHSFLIVVAGLIYLTFYLLNYDGLVPYSTYLSMGAS
ncbi:EpsG family protein [Cryobacterium sp. Hb1]|uniref:EpsG family protein n=1 Tax=Cryobacterium sp. Hb1 TaxID=1259147 RepID=UPI00141BA46B|nr:EpsG family protein [Cryobacterium sp. Hb1]